jgi:hypothetical protein
MREAVIIALAWLSHFDHGGRSNHSIRPEMTERRFPPPWSIDELEACFVARDHTGACKMVACRWPSC